MVTLVVWSQLEPFNGSPWHLAVIWDLLTFNFVLLFWLLHISKSRLWLVEYLHLPAHTRSYKPYRGKPLYWCVSSLKWSVFSLLKRKKKKEVLIHQPHKITAPFPSYRFSLKPLKEVSRQLLE